MALGCPSRSATTLQSQPDGTGRQSYRVRGVGRLESLNPIEENDTVHIGIALQNNQGIEDVQSIIQFARRAEELGFASVWAHDHGFNAAHVFRRIGTKPYRSIYQHL
jgi:hypothetical protein